MNVHLSFDVEIWCNGWAHLDQRFPAAFDRYVHGRSAHGSYALPKTLELLQRHGLRGVFFVEPLFAARFGQDYLRQITEMIEAAGQDVQLHLHPEWTDEIRPPLIDDVARKRQHLTLYTQAEQTALIAFGKKTLQAATRGTISAFRAGSYAANAATYGALLANGIHIDSSLNEVEPESGPDVPAADRGAVATRVGGVASYPVTVFQDGFGRLRPAQVGACSFAEMRGALLDAEAKGRQHFVIVSHNFEMLKPGSSEPDMIVVSRFERLCAFLGSHGDRFKVGSYPAALHTEPVATARPKSSVSATARRHAEQAWRRLP